MTTTQTTTDRARTDRPLVLISDAAPSRSQRALAWTGVALASVAVWASVILGAVLVFARV